MTVLLQPTGTHPIVDCESLTYPSVACFPPFLSAIFKTGDLNDGRSASPVALIVKCRRASIALVLVCGAQFSIATREQILGILDDKASIEVEIGFPRN